MRWKLVTGPASEPFEIGDLKGQIRITHTSQDDLLLEKLTAARKWVEDYMGLFFMTQTWDVKIDSFPAGGKPIRIYPFPIQSLTHIKYYDENNEEQTWDSGQYEYDFDDRPGEIFEAYGYSYPTTLAKRNAITIQLVCGYAAIENIPPDYKSAVLMRASHLFLNPSDVVTGTQVNQMPDGSISLLRPTRIIEL